MAITARELVFYVRAEDQASRVVKRVARSFGSLSNIRALENKGLQQNVTNLRNIASAQQAIRRNQDAITMAEARASKLGRYVASGRGIPGSTLQETANLHQAALSNAATLRREEELLGQDLDEVRRKGLAASAAIDQQVSQAKLDRLRSYAGEVQNLGRVLRLVGVIGVAAFGFAAHAAAQFSTQVTLAATQSTVAGKNTTAQVLRNSAELQKAILKLEGTGTVTAKLPEQTNSVYQIFSGITLRGNQTQQLQKGITLLKEFNKVATANYGFVSLQDVTRAGIALINRFNLSIGQVPAVMNRMQAAVRFGALNMGQFVQGLNQVAPAFNAAGYSIDQMDASMAFISRKFPNVAQGFAGLARLTETLANPKILSGLKNQGITITDTTGHLKPLDQIISLILTKWPKLAKGGVDLQNFFKNIGGLQSTVQARRAFVSIAQDLSGYRRMIHDVTGDNNELQKSWEAMQKSPQVRWDEFINKLKTLVYEIGIYAIPAFTELGKPIARLVKWFDGLSEHTKHLIGTFGVFGSVGAIFGGTALIIAGSVARLILTFKELRLASIAAKAASVAALETTAATSETALLAETGAVNVAFLALGAVLISIAIILYKYPHILTVIVNAMGGLKNTIIALSLAMVAIKFRGFITGLLGMQTAMAAAEGEAATLAATLASIATMGVIAATVIVTYEVIVHRKGITNAINKAIDTGLGAVGVHLDQGPDKLTYNQALHLSEQRAKAWHMSLESAAEQTMTKAQLQIFETRPPTAASDVGQKVAAFHGRIAAAAQAARDAANRNKVNPITGMSPATWNPQKAIAQVVALYKLTEKAPTQANYKKYYQTLADLRKHYTGVDLQALDSYLSALESATNKSARKIASNAKKAADALKQQLKDAASNVTSMYDTLLQQNQSVMGQLFQGPYVQSGAVQNVLQAGGALSGSDLLKDLQSQNKQFTNFYNTIDKLRKRGAPQELIQQLIAAGPQALPAIKALSGMGDTQWKVYVKTFNRGQELLHKQTILQLKLQLKDYRKYGQNIALQIISGMRDKRLGLANEIQSIIENMFGVKTPVVTGAAKKNLANATKAAKSTPHHLTHPHTYTGQTTNTKPVVGTGTRTPQSVTYNYNVTAPTSEHTSVQTQLRHAEFASKTKYKRHN